MRFGAQILFEGSTGLWVKDMRTLVWNAYYVDINICLHGLSPVKRLLGKKADKNPASTHTLQGCQDLPSTG